MRLNINCGWVLAVLLIGAGMRVEANNISLANVGLTKQDLIQSNVMVTFDIAWSNSWRGSENWDAAWVFVKFRAPGSNHWEHAQLATVNAAHAPVTGSTIDAVPDGKGVFLYRSAGYTGDVSYAGTQIRWNYGSNGYGFAKGALVEVSVHAIEMVYIPQGPFFLGGCGAEANRFYQYTDGIQTTNTFLINSEDEITVGQSAGYLHYVGTPGSGDGAGPVSNYYPKGYNAIYCMKYEVTQGQYVDFLNKLTAVQWTNRNTGANFGNYRHTISGTVTNSTVITPDRACNYVGWSHMCAYLDWAALRPMSELEFEKICRGSANPVANECAWGNTTKTNLTGHAGVDGSGAETALPVSANCSTTWALGPVRVGIFAKAGSTRVSSGATYYGVMEMTGNLWERVIGIGTGLERGYRGTLGDGVLAANGNATGNSDWPDVGTLMSSAVGYRGGCSFGADLGYIAMRLRGGEGHGYRIFDYGARGVRQAP